MISADQKNKLIEQLTTISAELKKICNSSSPSYLQDEKDLCKDIPQTIDEFLLHDQDRIEELILGFSENISSVLEATKSLFKEANNLYSISKKITGFANKLKQTLKEINPPKPSFEPTKEMLETEKNRV